MVTTGTSLLHKCSTTDTTTSTGVWSLWPRSWIAPKEKRWIDPPDQFHQGVATFIRSLTPKVITKTLPWPSNFASRVHRQILYKKSTTTIMPSTQVLEDSRILPVICHTLHSASRNDSKITGSYYIHLASFLSSLFPKRLYFQHFPTYFLWNLLSLKYISGKYRCVGISVHSPAPEDVSIISCILWFLIHWAHMLR